MTREALIPRSEADQTGGIRRAELRRREAVFIGKDGENGLRMRVSNNTAVFLAQLEDGRETRLGRERIEAGEEYTHEMADGKSITIFGGELVLGRKRSFVFSVPDGYRITKLVPTRSLDSSPTRASGE